MFGRILVKFALFGVAIAAIARWVGLTEAFAFGCVIATLAWWINDRRLAQLLLWLDGRGRIPHGGGLWGHVFTRIYRRQRAHAHELAELNIALERFQTAAQALPDGVVTLDAEHRIMFCNAVAADVFGLDPEADAGQVITNLVRLPEFAAFLRAEQRPAVLTLRLVRGQTRVLQVQLVAYGDGRSLLLARDITQLDRLETMRRDFVANVSHELKTPLTVLAGFLETIHEHEELPPEQKRHLLNVMNEQAVRMRRIVEDLLTLSALEASPLAPRDTRVALDPLLARLETSARSLSHGRHALTFEIEPHLALLGTETELASAFENLISNAIRYTPDGGSIRVRAWTGEEDGDASLHFEVSDTGIGIEAQHLPRLTERFYRVDRSRSRDSGGTGLGLAIVKHVLTRHEGALRIQSEYGRGTTMTAVFPARRIARPLQISVNAT